MNKIQIIIKIFFRFKGVKKFLFIVSLFFYLQGHSQCKTFLLSTNNDTINCTDNNNLKQGKWILNIAALRGEPAKTEEGLFKDDKKQGQWITFNSMGDVLAEENYKWGYKNGTCNYYNLIGLIRTESWKSIDPENPYDTVDVYGLSNNPDTVYKKVVKVEASCVKHGTWNYYDPERGTIIKTEEYILDQVVVNKPKKFGTDSLAYANPALDSLSQKNKPPEVIEFEKKMKKKKNQVRDGETGVD